MRILISLFLLFNTAQGKTLSEEQKIDILLNRVKQQQNAVFMRNGGEHSPEDAYEHLQRKLRYGWWHDFSDGTASEFIDKIASESSSSGKKYQIKIKVKGKDKIIYLRDFLLKKLAEIEKKAKTPG